MSGYTPVFDSVFQGTLCGKYPDLPVWLVLLALQQRGGIIDAHPSYIATVSGLPQADIELAIQHFCEPDPASRTPDNDGRRLVALEGKGFGWRVVNHERYRQKARKQEYDEKRTESGADAERKRAERAASRTVPPCPTESRLLPLSDAEAKTIKKKKGADAPPFDPASVPGLDPHAWGLWVEHRTAIKKTIRPHSMPDAAEELAKLGTQQLAEVKRARAGGWQGLHPEKPNGHAPPSKREREPTKEEIAEARRKAAADNAATAQRLGFGSVLKAMP